MESNRINTPDGLVTPVLQVRRALSADGVRHFGKTFYDAPTVDRLLADLTRAPLNSQSQRSATSVQIAFGLTPSDAFLNDIDLHTDDTDEHLADNMLLLDLSSVYLLAEGNDWVNLPNVTDPNGFVQPKFLGASRSRIDEMEASRNRSALPPKVTSLSQIYSPTNSKG